MCFSSNQFMSTVHPSIHPSISPSFIFIHSFFRSFVRSFMIGPSIHPPIHTLIHSFIYFIYSFVRAIIHHQFCLDFLMISCPPPPPTPLTPYQRQTSSTSTCKGAVLSGDELLHQIKILHTCWAGVDFAVLRWAIVKCVWPQGWINKRLCWHWRLIHEA